MAALLLMAMIWGSSFVVMKGTLDRLPAADMLTVRYAIAFGVLAMLAWKHLFMSWTTAKQGLVMGALFATGQISQTFGLGMTHASVSGFLTGTYVIFTPLLASALFRTRIGRNVWLGVGFAIVGLGVLSIVPTDGGGFGLGEALTLLGAVAFAGHIIATGRFATTDNAMSLTLMQTGFVVVACALFALPGGITLPASAGDWTAILYLAVIAGAATLFLQNWAQAHVESTKAAVVMCSEPVWAAAFAVGLGMEPLTWQMIVGGTAIIAAMYLVVGRVPMLRLPTILGAASRRQRAIALDHLVGGRHRDRRILHYESSIEAALRQRT